MLENESTDQNPSSADATAPEAESPAPPARRRRRAASRPAGPPVTAETDEPGEVRRTGAAADPIFDAPWSAANRSGESSSQEPRPLVSDPFAVPAIDVSALRPAPAAESEEDSGSDDDAAADDRPAARSGSRSRSGGRSRSRSASSKADDKKSDDAKADDDKKSDDAKSEDNKAEDNKAEDDKKSDDAKAEDDKKSDDAKADDASSDHDSDGDSDDQDSDGSGRRRRRRRGGRRRRRGGSDDGSNGSDDANDSADDAGSGSSGSDDNSKGNGKESSSDSGSADGSDDSDGESSGSRRRRRRRRRRSGEDADETARRRANEAVTGIDGSTRLEAKRQRRREGREAGRRRAPILSEAEFLARRESVRRTMVIRQREALAQIAVLEDNVLVEHYVDHSSSRSLIGNVYLGKVQNVLPSMEAAFIDIGQGRNAVLYAGEIDWSAFDTGGNKERKIESVLKSGQTVLVQVTKDPIGQKGARLTHNISLPGRYIVYSPGGHLSGISRKLPDTERKRLKKVLSDHVDESASVIVRTAAEGASEDELVRDVTRLKAQWQAIEKKVKSGGAPQLLHAEPDPTVRIVRDLFTEDFAELVIAGNGTADDAYDNVMSYVEHVAPHLADRVKRWDGGDNDVFAAHRIDEQIAKGLERKVHLPSGGSLVIDRTEAMTVIDVNTGKFTGSGGNLEATVTSNNLEAAEEIVRQLRLRDIGGIIVIDFIDMVLPSNRELLLRRLVECLGRDRTRHQVAEVTSLGLVQMTRKRIGTGLGEAFTTTCEHCQGKGRISHDEPVEVKPDTSNNNGSGRGRGRSRGGSRNGNNNAKSKSESPKTPPRQPLPKVMPPPPPGLARVTGTDDNAEDHGHESTGTDEATPDTTAEQTASTQDKAADSKATEHKAAEDKAAEDKDTTADAPADAAPEAEVDPVAAAMDALVADRAADS